MKPTLPRPFDPRPDEPPEGAPWDVEALSDAWDLIDQAQNKIHGAGLLDEDLGGKIKSVMDQIERCMEEVK